MKKLWCCGLAALLWQSVAQAQDVPQVMTSFSILHSVTADLAGQNHVNVNTLIGRNQNSHGHQLRASDVQNLQNSQLIVFNGLGFESAALQRAAKNTQVPIVEAAAGLDGLLQADAEHEHHDHAHETEVEHAAHAHEHQHESISANHTGLDPHVWLDPLKMPAYTRNITQALIKQQPENSLYYGLRWQMYQLKLAGLHGENAYQLASIPVAKRKVLTSHAAFGYMGQRYQIEFFAPVGGGHEAEASAKTLVDLIRQVKTQHIQAVFVENIADERLLKQLTQETGLSIQGTLYSDALADDAPDYFALYRHNVKVLRQALQS
ncbi:periplasmic zinc-binding protein [Vitreoscilla sp. C1]|uniref:metal ABC transporter solute-binding protein, Zn/Mn family n=1 Tax=Vitreoscilla sp. (strain C1) TaxID=96942 RepID=UPI00148EDCD0|nr:zinc ABC transporter substrate-binding protein [Vitreoscilla sp. C1]AUZ04804.2 periplasmic zinc-binding protein [Vitreoscilla sp. C1]